MEFTDKKLIGSNPDIKHGIDPEVRSTQVFDDNYLFIMYKFTIYCTRNALRKHTQIIIT